MVVPHNWGGHALFLTWHSAFNSHCDENIMSVLILVSKYAVTDRIFLFFFVVIQFQSHDFVFKHSNSHSECGSLMNHKPIKDLRSIMAPLVLLVLDAD